MPPLINLKDLEMKKVYVTQIPHRKDQDTGAFVPAFNISPAQEHGDIIVMMPPRASFYNTADLVKQLDNHLREYDYEAGDSIISIGDPSIIAVAFAILGKKFGKFTVLKWDRNTGRYVKSIISV